MLSTVRLVSFMPAYSSVRPRIRASKGLPVFALFRLVSWPLWSKRLPLLCSHYRREFQIPAELAHVEVVVEAAGAKELVVGAALDDLAIFERQHLVGVADRAQPVGDDERSPPVEELFQRFLNQPLGSRIHRRGSLIQNQNPRVGQGGPGNRQQLTLALAQATAPLAEHRLVAVG